MATIKILSENFCEECNAPARAVKVAKNKAARDAKQLTGIVWDCPNGHINRTRKHVLKEVKVG